MSHDRWMNFCKGLYLDHGWPMWITLAMYCGSVIVCYALALAGIVVVINFGWKVIP